MSWGCARPTTASRSSPTRTAELGGGAGARRYWWIWLAVVPIALWALVRALRPRPGLPAGAADGLHALRRDRRPARRPASPSRWATGPAATLAALAPSAWPPRCCRGRSARAPSPPPATRRSPCWRPTSTAAPPTPRPWSPWSTACIPDLLSVEELTPAFARKLGAAARPPAALRGAPTAAPLLRRRPLLAPAAAQRCAGAGRGRRPHAAGRADPADGRRVRVVDVHPDPPKRQHRRLGRRARRACRRPARPPGSWRATSTRPSTSRAARVVDRGYRDAGEVAGKGLEPTFPARVRPAAGSRSTMCSPTAAWASSNTQSRISRERPPGHLRAVALPQRCR